MSSLGTFSFSRKRGSRVRFLAGTGNFSLRNRGQLGPTRPSVLWILGAVSLVLNPSGREADHSSPSSAEIKNTWSCVPPLPNTSSWCGD
jgi:hypothetical protein